MKPTLVHTTSSISLLLLIVVAITAMPMLCPAPPAPPASSDTQTVPKTRTIPNTRTVPNTRTAPQSMTNTIPGTRSESDTLTHPATNTPSLSPSSTLPQTDSDRKTHTLSPTISHTGLTPSTTPSRTQSVSLSETISESLSQTETVSLSPPYFAPPYYRLLYQHTIIGFFPDVNERIYNTSFSAVQPAPFQKVIYSKNRDVVLLNESFTYDALKSLELRLIAVVPSHEDAPQYLLEERKEPMMVVTWAGGDGGPQHTFTWINASFYARWYVDPNIKSRGGSSTATFKYPSITTNPVVSSLTYYLNVVENQAGALLQLEPMLGRVDALWTWRRIVDGVNVLSAYIPNFRLEVRPGKCVKSSNSSWSSKLFDDSVGGLQVYYFGPLAEEGYVPIPLIEDPAPLTVRDPLTGAITTISCGEIEVQLLMDDAANPGVVLNVSSSMSVIPPKAAFFLKRKK